MKGKFSIILPVYNAGQYLRNAVSSVLRQSYTEWELILVDDGSSDGSGTECDSYLEQDTRIRVIHQTNKGVSSARNAGLDIAEGEYILFLDSDDYFEENALCLIAERMIGTDIDMIVFDYFVDVSGCSYRYSIAETSKEDVLYRDYIESKIMPGMLNLCDFSEGGVNVQPFIWNKVYKRKIIEEHGIRFNEELRKWEDKIFQLLYIKWTNSVLFLEGGLYHYVQADKERLSSKCIPEIFMNVATIYGIMEEHFGKQFCLDNRYSNSYYFKVIIGLAINQIQVNRCDAKKVITDAMNIPQIRKWVLNAKTDRFMERIIQRCVKTDKISTTYRIYVVMEKEIKLKKILTAIINTIQKIRQRFVKKLFGEVGR